MRRPTKPDPYHHVYLQRVPVQGRRIKPLYARTVLEMNETNAPFAAFESAVKMSLNVIDLVGQNKPKASQSGPCEELLGDAGGLLRLLVPRRRSPGQ